MAPAARTRFAGVKRLLEKLRWHANERLIRRLGLLNAVCGRLTLVCQFTTPGDTLLAGTVGHVLLARWPRLRLNVVVRQPKLLEADPNFAEINGPLGPWRLTFHYLSVIADRRPEVNVLQPVMDVVGIDGYNYRTRVYLTEAERASAHARLARLRRPIVTVNLLSREPTKTWARAAWEELIGRLRVDHDVVQLGDASEPAVEGVTSFAGRLSLRESMAILSCARVHVGPVSFLMHAANGLDVPAVIIYGGRETPANSGYASNRNLFVPMPCGPCWLHEAKKERCGYGMACMTQISPDQVFAAVTELISSSAARSVPQAG